MHTYTHIQAPRNDLALLEIWLIKTCITYKYIHTHIQAPRNDFALLLKGASLDTANQISLVPSAETCPANAKGSLDSTHTGPKSLTAAGTMTLPNGNVTTTGTHVGSFEWVTNLCKPTLNGALGHIMPDDKCPPAGWYRLCYLSTSAATGIETGISVYVQQANVTVTTPFFTKDMIHPVKTPFEVVVQLVDADNQPCCSGTKVHLSLTKNGADHSEYLYNAANSNLPADKIVIVGSDGIATFSNYTIQRTAGIKFYLTASVAGHSVNIPPVEADVQGYFQVRPRKLTVSSLDGEYIVQATAALLTTPIQVRAEDADGILLTGLVATDLYHCEVQLQTAGGGLNSAANTTYAGIGGNTTTADLLPAGFQNGGADGRPVFAAGIAVFADMTTVNQAGRYFRLRFQNSEHSNIPVEGYSTVFMITPSKMKLANGTVDYAAGTFPKTLRLGGDPAVDALPSVIKVSLLSSDGTVLTSANCLSCMTVRLVKCDTSTYNSGTTGGSTAVTAFPTCGTDHSSTIVQGGDQMNGYSDAHCARETGLCTWWRGGWRQTLSTATGTIAGNVVNVENGVATFNNLQILYTYGAGFRLRFVYDFFDDTPDFVNPVYSYHTAVHTNIFFPDIGLHVTADVKSFIILPYKLEMLQHPGGDGVDIDSATSTPGDGYANTPDGVGRNIPFRVQPAVAVVGKNSDGVYYFNSPINNHGHTPLTAVIRSASCGTTCVTDGLVLSGDTTGVSLTHKIATPVVQSGTDEWATFSGAGVSSERVEVRFISQMGLQGFLWKDLKITTNDAQTAVEGLKLEIMTGFETDSVAAAGTTYTTVTTGSFDIFIAPDPPLHVRILGYGPEGYRIEFDPAKIFRTKPLSGFIIEIDKCSQSGSTSGSCALQTIEGYDAGATVAPRALGSDYYSAGGRAEEVLLSYDPKNSSTATAVTITMYPTDYINEGDKIKLSLNSPGIYISTTAGACVPGGAHGGSVNASLDTATSTVELTVKTGFFFIPKQPVTITLPTTCGVVYPNTDPVSYVSTATFPDAGIAAKQIWRYGKSVYPTPLKYAVAYITGSILGDNCKGTGCVVSGATNVLPTIQDGVSWMYCILMSFF